MASHKVRLLLLFQLLTFSELLFRCLSCGVSRSYLFSSAFQIPTYSPSWSLSVARSLVMEDPGIVALSRPFPGNHAP